MMLSRSAMAGRICRRPGKRIRLWTRAVVKMVLPARLSPVTARRTVRSLAQSRTPSTASSARSAPQRKGLSNKPVDFIGKLRVSPCGSPCKLAWGEIALDGPVPGAFRATLRDRVARPVFKPGPASRPALLINRRQPQLADDVLDDGIEAVTLLLGRQALDHGAIVSREVILEAWPQGVVDLVSGIAAIARNDRAERGDLAALQHPGEDGDVEALDGLRLAPVAGLTEDPAAVGHLLQRVLRQVGPEPALDVVGQDEEGVVDGSELRGFVGLRALVDLDDHAAALLGRTVIADDEAVALHRLRVLRPGAGRQHGGRQSQDSQEELPTAHRRHLVP